MPIMMEKIIDGIINISTEEFSLACMEYSNLTHKLDNYVEKLIKLNNSKIAKINPNFDVTIYREGLKNLLLKL
jgi:hypothetical protein